MASRYKDRQPAPGCTAEVERMERQGKRLYAAPTARKAQGHGGPRRAPPWKAETRVSAPFRRAKAAPKLGAVEQANLDARVEAAILKIEANIQAESAARVVAAG